MTITPAERRSAEIEAYDPTTSAFPVLFNAGADGGFAEIVAANFGDEGFNVRDLERLHVQPGGNTRWGSDEGDEDEIEGVIVFWGVTRAYFSKGLDDVEETSPPDCASPDGKEGIGLYGILSSRPEGANPRVNPTGACETCPMNEWESGKGKSKACKEQRQLWILREGEILPVQVSLPPTSIGPFRKYMTRLAGKGKFYYGVRTRLTLEAVKMGPNKVAQVRPSVSGELHPAEIEAAARYSVQIQAYLRDSIRNDVEGAVVGDEGPAAGPAGADPQDPWAGEDEAGLPPIPDELQG